ncbi:MAG TPA: hypothetical protein VGC09_00405 [Rhodopila sp.]
MSSREPDQPWQVRGRTYYPPRYIIAKLASGRLVVDVRDGKIGYRPSTADERAALIKWPPLSSADPA